MSELSRFIAESDIGFYTLQIKPSKDQLTRSYQSLSDLSVSGRSETIGGIGAEFRWSLPPRGFYRYLVSFPTQRVTMQRYFGISSAAGSN